MKIFQIGVFFVAQMYNFGEILELTRNAQWVQQHPYGKKLRGKGTVRVTAIKTAHDLADNRKENFELRASQDFYPYFFVLKPYLGHLKSVWAEIFFIEFLRSRRTIL